MAITPPFNIPTAASAPTGVVHHVATASRVYAPTFDCCATCMRKFGVADNLINNLISTRTKATFFLTGEWMIAHPDAARRLIAANNLEIGFHGFSHSDFPLLSSNPRAMAHEINSTREVYKALLRDMRDKGQLSQTDFDRRMGANLFRFPSGHFNEASLAAVRNAGLIPIQWNATADGTMRPQLHHGERMEGSIHLAHANMSINAVQRTNQTFPEFHRYMTSQGYQAVTVSELMKMGRVVYSTQPERLTSRDHQNIARNQSDNERLGFGVSTYNRFMAGMPRPTHIGQTPSAAPRASA
ncbi:MAG: polysaccharide deacetylase family protein [Alphaproteobacteria bacterium]|nr:polysaccharide deacetylase family protein [Alphaproteobacteria bacterium]